MKVKFFNPGLEFKTHEKEYVDEYKRVRRAGDLILRKDVEDFEKNLAEYVGTRYAVALNSCTDALYLALRALKIGPGDEVLVPSRTFVASVQVIVQVGATPVFYDLDGAMTISHKTRAIIPVHIEGAFDTSMDAILALAAENNLYIIEDAAQALGAEFLDKKAGSWGIAGCFSFYPAKILGAPGDGGALVTDDEDIYKYVKDCRNHFKDDARDWGVNSRLDNVHAAELNLRIKRLPVMLARRKEIAEKYHNELTYFGGDAGLPPQIEGRVWQDYIIRLSTKEGRDAMYGFLKEKGVETLKNNYPFPVPKLPKAQHYEDTTLRLPCNELLKNEEVDYVIKCIKEFFQADWNDLKKYAK